MRMILREGVAKLGAGVVLGVVVMYFAARLPPLLYQISPRDPLVILAAIVGFPATGLVAAMLPALRAMRLDPPDALRQE